MGNGKKRNGRELARPAGQRTDPSDVQPERWEWEVPEPSDVPPGPAGWELYGLRAFWTRIDQAEAEGRPVSGPPGEKVRADDRPRPLSPASALEDLLGDLLDAAFGPPVRDGMPNRRSEPRRTLARVRLLRRLRTPVRRRRFQRYAREILTELERRARNPGRKDEAPDPSMIEALRRHGVGSGLADRLDGSEDEPSPGLVLAAFCEALDRALHRALADPRVQGASAAQLVEDAAADRLKGRLRVAVADALVRDLAPLAEEEREEEPPANWPASLDAVADAVDDEDDDEGEDERPDGLARPDPRSLYLERRIAAFRADEQRVAARRRLERLDARLRDEEERAVLRAVLAWWRRHPSRDAPDLKTAHGESGLDVSYTTFWRRWKALQNRLRRGGL